MLSRNHNVSTYCFVLLEYLEDSAISVVSSLDALLFFESSVVSDEFLVPCFLVSSASHTGFSSVLGLDVLIPVEDFKGLDAFLSFT